MFYKSSPTAKKNTLLHKRLPFSKFDEAVTLFCVVPPHTHVVVEEVLRTDVHPESPRACRPRHPPPCHPPPCQSPACLGQARTNLHVKLPAAVDPLPLGRCQPRTPNVPKVGFYGCTVFLLPNFPFSKWKKNQCLKFKMFRQSR